MREIFKFYMYGQLRKPVFGTNRSAALMWVLAVFSVGSFVAFLALAATHRTFSSDAVVFLVAACVLLGLSRLCLPSAKKQYELDRIIRKHDGEQRAKAERWMKKEKIES